MICGTSTGGIIALGISQKIPMNQICEFYKQHGPLIFDEKNRRFLRTLRDSWRQIFWRGKFSNENLKAALINVFGDKKIKDSEIHYLFYW
jgi:patatin-like phospholipase/acyl hydrolase